MKLTIKINATANTTPERTWDYEAFFEGYEEHGPRATAATPGGAICRLFDDDSSDELQKVFMKMRATPPAEPTPTNITIADQINAVKFARRICLGRLNKITSSAPYDGLAVQNLSKTLDALESATATLRDLADVPESPDITTPDQITWMEGVIFLLKERQQFEAHFPDNPNDVLGTIRKVHNARDIERAEAILHTLRQLQACETPGWLSNG